MNKSNKAVDRGSWAVGKAKDKCSVRPAPGLCRRVEGLRVPKCFDKPGMNGSHIPHVPTHSHGVFSL